MKIETDPKLDFNNVLIRPKRSTLSSRSEVSLEREFTFPHSTYTWKGTPVISANMDTITDAGTNTRYRYRNRCRQARKIQMLGSFARMILWLLLICPIYFLSGIPVFAPSEMSDHTYA